MYNLKKAALNITSKFGLLNSQRTLVLAISEEREVHETLLKLVLARVNASTSLLRWAKKEENHSMKEAVCRLYDVSLMFASVQRELAEQSNAVNNSLKEILDHEVNLETLRKRLKDVSERREKLEKLSPADSKKKLNPTDEIIKLKEEEENLKTDLEVKLLQTEIFKSSSIKGSLKMVCNAHLKYAEKLSLIFTAANKVVDSIKDVPDHVKPHNKLKQKVSEVELPDTVVELAKSLNINKPISSNMSNPSSIFHVDIGLNNGKSNQIKMLQKAELKKTISHPVLLSPPSQPFQTIDSKDSSIVYPHYPPYDSQSVTSVNQSRSKTSEIFWSHIYASESDSGANRCSSFTNEYDEVGFKLNLEGAESFGRLYRSASDSTISSSKANEIYSEPFEELVVEHNFINDVKPHSHSVPNDYGGCYQDPIEKFVVKTHISTTLQDQRDGLIYCDPVAPLENGSSYPPSESYENTEKIMNAVEYMDNQYMQEPLRSKLDLLENIILNKKTPTPPPKPKLKTNKNNQKKMYSSVRLPESPKEVPPRPKPRPKTSLYESPISLNIPLENSPSDFVNDKLKKGSVKEMAAHMSGKFEPASLVPSMTQAKLREQENSDYQNI